MKSDIILLIVLAEAALLFGVRYVTGDWSLAFGLLGAAVAAGLMIWIGRKAGDRIRQALDEPTETHWEQPDDDIEAR